jgi:sugar-specific transcriptional regulator TrmB
MTATDAQSNMLKLNDPHLRSSASLEGVEVLMGLGLSGRQARVYLALLRCGDANARVIADCSVVERQEAYRLLEDLSKMGLVKRNLSIPTTYSATPISVGIALLLQQKTLQINRLRQQTKGLIEKYSNSYATPKSVGARPCFGVVHEADRGRKYQSTIKTCTQSLEAITSWRRFKQLSFHFENDFQEALLRGVCVRLVTEKPLSHRLPSWVKLALVRYPNFGFKTLPCLPEVEVAVFDGCMAAMAFDVGSSLTAGLDLWTLHGGLVAVCRGYFEGQWGKGKGVNS